MNFVDYAPLALRTAKQLPHDLQVQHAQLGMLTELGELGDAIKKHFIYGKPFDKVNALEEIGDFCWYLNLYCDQQAIHPRTLDGYLSVIKLETGSDVSLTLSLTSVLGGLMLSESERGGVTDCVLVQVLLNLFALLADRWGSTLQACLDVNIKKLAARYGDKYSDAAALIRDLGAERKVLEG